MQQQGTTGTITRLISQRRSYRRYWRIVEYVVMLILDILLIHLSFVLAYQVRYNIIGERDFLRNIEKILTGNNITSKFTYVGIEQFASFEKSIIIGLIIIFALRGLYKIRLTGSWFHQARTITSATTVGLTLLIAYYFVFQATNNSRLLVPFVWAAVIVVLCVARLIVAGIMGILHQLGLGTT
ncbi:MAG: hypothetical protein JO215_15325, partial [Ktedonobacteraceae bacterium]|nr:hypothetical protein [Ktedonobacteraceae bacterium]